MVPAIPAPQTGTDSPAPSPQEVIEQLNRLLAGRHLRESHQLQSFLDYVVRETLEGRQDGLKEYLLGCRVFGRRPDYDPRHDGIVRVQATTLRKRLEKYYLAEGASDPIVIDLPRGGYVPCFRYAEPVAVAPVAEVMLEHVPAQLPPPSTTRPRASTARGLIAAFFAGSLFTALLCSALWFTYTHNRPAPFKATKASPSDFPQLWGPFFAPNATNLVAYGVPLFYGGGTFYVRDTDADVPGAATEQRIKQIFDILKATPIPADDIYTGVGEVEGTQLVSNFFSTHGTPVRITNARTLGRSELAGHNLIVVSSLRFQTLLSELRLPAEFEFVRQRPEIIRNLHPAPGENQTYVFLQGEGVSTSYALVGIWPGITPDTRIAHVGGVHTWATQAAMEFLLQPEQLRHVAAEFAKDRPSGPHGRISPYFQILLRVEGRGNQFRRVEYVTHRYLPGDFK